MKIKYIIAIILLNSHVNLDAKNLHSNQVELNCLSGNSIEVVLKGRKKEQVAIISPDEKKWYIIDIPDKKYHTGFSEYISRNNYVVYRANIKQIYAMDQGTYRHIVTHKGRYRIAVSEMMEVDSEDILYDGQCYMTLH